MRPALLLAGLLIAASPVGATELRPFVATYDAWYQGKSAGTATMRLAPQGNRWDIGLDIRGNRGFAGILGLNLSQNTVFDLAGGLYRPLQQSTVRKAAVFFNRRVTGLYDWSRNVAQWSGDLKASRKAPVALQSGDMSALLINLAVIRDAMPGVQLQYRFVDGGRVREYRYQAEQAPEIVPVGEMSYSALRVSRTNGGNDEMIIWVADGVPTPVRILQREDGEDAIDLRLVEYQGVQ